MRSIADLIHRSLRLPVFLPLLTLALLAAAELHRHDVRRRQGLFTFIVVAGYAAVLMDWGENLVCGAVLLSAVGLRVLQSPP